MSKIIGLGNALVDILYRTDENKIAALGLPKGSMQLIDKEQKELIHSALKGYEKHIATGGSCANTIFALAKLGSKVGFVGKVGNDEEGLMFKQKLAEYGVEDRLMQSSDKETGIATTFITADGERTFATYLGSSVDINQTEIIADLFKDYSYLFIEGYLVQDKDLIIKAMETAKELNMQICLDMASYNIVENNLELFQLLINKYVDVVFANEAEAKAFSGKNIDKSLSALSDKCSIAVIKLGAKGSIIAKGSERIMVDSYHVEQLTDTTGAGDYYAAGFMYGLSCGYTLEKCGKIGSLLSSKIIQTIGTELEAENWNNVISEIENL